MIDLIFFKILQCSAVQCSAVQCSAVHSDRSMSGQCTVSTDLRAQQYLERVSLEYFLSKMTRKKNDGAVARYYLSVILILSAMMVVRGAWTDSSISTKTGFDYVSAVWSSSTTCVIVGNGATNARLAGG
jgi:hypothetical protein